jgi:predicted outer membrane protein
MLDQLKPVAEQMGVKVPAGPSKGQMKSMDKMKALSGEAFDQAYIKDMVKDHKGDDNDFKMEAQSTQNPQLKEMVTQSDQIIQSHLQMIEQISKSSPRGPRRRRCKDLPSRQRRLRHVMWGSLPLVAHVCCCGRAE